ncbi:MULTISPECIES: PP2C family protein-serine/threonine phosphatase [Bacteroides]|uniref:PP2C family protein-serine/threonine phosphatase n=1 Tax=Bacteroides TaxID=816 RepID=UPI00264995DA|nr:MULTISPECIES: protein phosphatase 2C domain-containing protein [Bacteroides]
MSRITFNIAAKCDKAGRAQNQDNYWVCPNLDNIQDSSTIGNDADVELSSKGALMVVADGMGGMKSGEKASEFVIEGIKAKFRNIPNDILNDDNAITSFIKNAIIEADQSIKEYAKVHRESEGMGSTIVLLWILGEKAYCAWCGDSRIYCYNPQNTLVRLSHDHSYVQSLVDDGKITEDEAFDHPDGNIITRSLGDSGEKASPETKIYPIHRRDVFLLCSDGLCGLLNDSKIDSILADNCTSSKDALAALWKEGEKEGWSDNATIEVVCITEGGTTPTRKAFGYDEGKPKPISVSKSKDNRVKKNTDVLPNFWQNNKNYILILAIVALVAMGIIWFFNREKKSGGSSNQEFNVEQPEKNGSNENVITEPEQTDNHNNDPIPNKPSKPSKPDKPNIPSKPNQGQLPTIPTQPQQPAQSQQSQEPQHVSEGYLRLMRDTYNSINTINQNIRNAQGRRHFTSAEANQLKDFQANANDLNSMPDVKVLSSDQKRILNQINGIARKAEQALRTYRAYDELPPVRQQPQHEEELPGRGVNTDDPYEDPIYHHNV